MAEKCLLLKLPNGLLTEADILTVVAMAIVVVAGRVAVLESAVVVEVQYRSNVSYHRRALRESRRALQESRSARRRSNCKFTKLGSCAIFCYYL